MASVPHRMASGAIDLLVIIGILLLAAVTFGLLTSGASQAVAATFGVVAVVVATVVVPTVVETLTRGRSLGRLIMGLRIVRDDGGPVGARHAPDSCTHRFRRGRRLQWSAGGDRGDDPPRGKRLGDMAAGTVCRVAASQAPHLIAPPCRGRSPGGLPRPTSPPSRPGSRSRSVSSSPARAAWGRRPARRWVANLADALTHVALPPPAGHHPRRCSPRSSPSAAAATPQRLVREESLRARLLR